MLDARAVGPAVTTATLAVPKGSTRAQVSVTAIAGSGNASEGVELQRTVAERIGDLPARRLPATVTMSLSTKGGSICLSSTGPVRALVDLTATG